MAAPLSIRIPAGATLRWSTAERKWSAGAGTMARIGGRMELRILSREDAEQYEPQGVEICISITDPAASPARLSPSFAAVLRLAFSDIVAVHDAEDVLFAPDDAAAIVAFVEQWRHAERLVVHCHVGVSRSPGVALGLCDQFGWPATALEERYPYWNRWVRQVLVSQRDAGASRDAGHAP